MAAADGPQIKQYNNQPLYSLIVMSIERGYVRRRRHNQCFAGQNTDLDGYPFFLFFCCSNAFFAADRLIGRVSGPLLRIP